MMKPDEERIQESVINKLGQLDIFPFSVVYTYCLDEFKSASLAMTFYLEQDLKSILTLLDYEKQCDKSGFLILKDSNTLVLDGMALLNFYIML